MKMLPIIAAASLGLSALPAWAAAPLTHQQKIAQALSPLPASLRKDVTVITYTAKGKPVNLRWGNNDIYCMPNQADSRNFRAVCFPRVMKPQEDMEARERAEGKAAMAIRADVDAAIASHHLPTPFIGTTLYIRSGKDEAYAHEMWVLMMPGVGMAQTGLPGEKGDGTPWMMRAGTPEAHLMVPVRGATDATG